MEQERILVGTATFNEVANIGEWIARVAASAPFADIMIVDDSSPDGTGRLVQELAVAYPRVTLMARPGKQGLGSAHKALFAYALSHDYDYLVTMDADLSHEPESLPSLLAAGRLADFVIGTRWGQGSCDYSGVRKAVSWTGNALARLLLRAPITEYTTSYRVFNRRSLDLLCQEPPDDDGYAFFVDVVALLHRGGMSLSEVPIAFRDRAGGESKIPRGQILKSSVRLVQLAALGR